MKLRNIILYLILISSFITPIYAETGVLTPVEVETLETSKEADAIENKDENIKKIESNEILEVEDDKNWALEYLEDKKDRIKDKLWFEWNTDLEQTISENKWEIVEVNLEKEILEKINEENKSLILELEEDLKLKYLEIDNLKIQISKNNNNDNEVEELNSKINNLNLNISELKNQIDNNLIQQKITSVRIQELILEAWELQIYKSKYEAEYKKEIDENLNVIYKNVLYYFIYFFIFIIAHIILKMYKNKFEKENKFDKLNKIWIAVIFLYIVLIFWTLIYLVVLKPEIALVFILIGSWIIISIRLVLASFFASFWTSLNYTLWEVVEIGSVTWKIIEKKLLSLIVLELDENYHQTWNVLKIPNYQLLESNVKKIKNYNLKQEELILNIDVEKIEGWLDWVIREVDNILYKKEMPICDKKNKKRYFLTVNLKKINEFELIFKYIKRKWIEVNVEIINKIISMKKIEEKINNEK